MEGALESAVRAALEVHLGPQAEAGPGSAADGAARVRGVGAVAVTYGVGAFSLLNTVGGA